MSLQLEDLVYKLRIDDSELSAGSRQATAEFERLSQSASRASDGFQKSVFQMARSAENLQMTSKQTVAALRQVPAQFTDIVTSLAAGQNPLIVFLQQGGQLKDQFGGAGEAARALGGYVAGLISPMTVLAGAAVAVGGAFLLGYNQSDQLEKAINRTGNAAGVTAGQFDRMVKEVAAAGDASEGAARKILLGMVQTGQVGPQALQAGATAAAAMAKAYGMTEEEVVKSFQGMSKGIADWAAEQNKSMNFLTLEQYKYIRALEEQGKTTEAQLFLFERLREAAGRVTTNLGSLERGWNAVGEAAGKAWQWMLGIGRESTLEERLAKAQSALADAERNLRDPANNGPFNRQLVRGSQEEVEAKRETVRLLQQQIAGQRTAAAEQARQAEANRKAIDAEREREKSRARTGPRQRQEFPYAITDPIADQKQAFLRSEILGRDATDKALMQRDERAAKEALQAAERAERERQQRLDQLMGASAFAQAQRIRENLTFLRQEFSDGRVQDVDAYNEALAELYKRLDEIERPAQKAGDALSTFADQAARNIQDSLGDTLQRMLEGNFEGIGRMWWGLLNRMVAQAAAARLNEALFGQQGPNGSRSGGWFDFAIRTIGAWAGFGNGGPWGSEGRLMPSTPRFALGGYHRGGLRIVGEQGPELEATGPARIFSARDTASILGAANARQPVRLGDVVVRIDSRTDAAQVQELVARGVAEGHRMTLEQLRLEGVR